MPRPGGGRRAWLAHPCARRSLIDVLHALDLRGSRARLTSAMPRLVAQTATRVREVRPSLFRTCFTCTSVVPSVITNRSAIARLLRTALAACALIPAAEWHGPDGPPPRDAATRRPDQRGVARFQADGAW